jgi:phosphate transport system substrate-binding protein
MSRRKKRAALAVVIIIIVAAVAAAASIILAMTFFSPNNNNDGTRGPDRNQTVSTPPGVGINETAGGGGPAQGPVEKTPINALSSPSALPFVDKWVAQYNSEKNLGNVKVTYSDRVDDAYIPLLYSNVSSFLADYSADLAIASRPAAAKDNFTYAGSVFLPVSAQAVAVVYNIPALPDVPSGLRFDPSTLYAVVSGNATYWDDPRIKSLNPGTSLPHEQIVVVHEGPAASASDMLARYLASSSASNNSSAIAWPESSLVADSANSLAAMVRQTPYSIGYVDFAFAVQTRMTYASLQNSDGQYLIPSADSIGAAVRNGTIVAVNPAMVNGTGSENPSPALVPPPPTVSIGQLGNGSYPVVGFYYGVFSDPNAAAPGATANETALAGRDAAIIDFMQWIVGSEGQQILQDMQYPSIYEQNNDLKAFADRVLGVKTEGPPASVKQEAPS